MNSSKLIFGCMTTLGLAIAAASNAQADADRDAIAERLKPVGQVCLQGQDCGTSPDAAASSGDTADAGNGEIDGEAIYSRVCFACHDNGVAGAPTRGDAASWGDRLDKELEELYASSINGLGAMPPRGGAPNLSDEEVMTATNYLLEPVYEGELPEVGGANGEAEAANGDEAEVADAGDAANGNGENGEDVAANGNGYDGAALYSSGGCATCHDIGLIGAPSLGDSAAWAERLDKGIDELYASSINGIGAMPPKGGNVSLDDDEVRAIVDYMVAEAE